MMLLRYSSGVRVVIHTANLVPSDWDKKTQGIWISPKMIFPPPDASGPVPTSFQQDLMQYLAAYRLPALNRWIDLLRTVDASGVRVELVGSVPSRADSKLVSDSWGLWKLRKLLSSHGTKPSCSSKQVVVGQFSSIGSLKDNPGAWVEGELLSAMCPQRSRLGPSSSGSNVTADIKFIYPCVENVRMCLEGYEGGGSLPYLQSVASKQPWLNKMLHKWSSDTFGRTVAIPHIKTYASFDSDFGKLSWFLLTSANLSQAAWGSVTKKDSTLFIRSYELGVLFLPSRFNEEYFKPTTFPVPYDLPPIPYGSNDSPWIFDTPKERPDRFGRVFARR